MRDTAQQNCAQFADKLLQRCALGMLLTTVLVAFEALRFLLDEESYGMMEYVRYGLRGLVLLALVPIVLDAIRLRPTWRALLKHDEGFIALVFQKAATYSFAATFVAISVLENIAGKDDFGLPPEFYLEIAMIVSLATFSISFFVLNRSDSDEMDEPDGKANTDFDEGHRKA